MPFDPNKLTKNLVQDGILAPYLERVFEGFDEEFVFKMEPKPIDDAWHPSGDCIPSATDLYLKASGVVKGRPPSGSLRKSFMVGHFWHQLIQHIVVHYLAWCTKDQVERVGTRGWGDLDRVYLTWDPYHWVCGAGDFAPLTAPNGWSGIVDIKTMSSADFKKAELTGLLPQRFEKKYICQMNIYMDLFEQEQAMILGVNKDSPHGFKEFTFVRDQNLIDAIYAKWKYVGNALQEGVKPTQRDDDYYELPI